jgi:hypothetical protein
VAGFCVTGRTVPQFDASRYESRNCGVSVTRSMIHFGSRAIYLPGPTQTRKRMGNEKGWTTPLDMKRAVDSYDTEMLRQGFEPLRYKLAGTWSGEWIIKGSARSSLLARVKRLEMVAVVVDYGTVNATRPALSGSPTFWGRHMVWIGGGTKKNPGWRKRGGRIEVRYSDSTWGRPGAPTKAPKWVPFAWVWKIADGAWSSRGGSGWVGGSVACAGRLSEPPEPPEPEPCADLQDQLDAALAELQLAEEQLEEARVLIEALKVKRLPRELIDRLVALAAEIDAAYVPTGSDAPAEGGPAMEGD